MIDPTKNEHRFGLKDRNEKKTIQQKTDSDLEKGSHRQATRPGTSQCWSGYRAQGWRPFEPEGFRCENRLGRNPGEFLCKDEENE